jgi:uncharacterized protein (TIGR03437 family)
LPPSYLYPAPFVTRLSADGSSLSQTQLAYGVVVNPFAEPSLVAPTFGPGSAEVVAGTLLAFLNLFGPTPSFVCATDAADMAPLAQIVPGQLVSLFGEGIGAGPSVVSQPQGGQIPTLVGQTKVIFHGLPAPILFNSPNQINVQVPYQVLPQLGAPLLIMNGDAEVGSSYFMVTPIQPSAFVLPGYAICQGTITNSLLPVALNADGSLNSCDNPASVGDTVTLLVNGLGLAGAIQTQALWRLRERRSAFP